MLDVDNSLNTAQFYVDDVPEHPDFLWGTFAGYVENTKSQRPCCKRLAGVN